MPNIAKLLKEEIRRVARKELKEATAKLIRANSELRRSLVQQKRRIAALEKQSGRLRRMGAPEPQFADEAKPGGRLRISSTTIKNVRSRMGLTQSEFGRLIGVSGQSVYQWERKNGQLRLRNSTRRIFAEVKDFGAKQARARLNEIATAKKPGRKRG
ncbi:MAG: hypothetical protein AMXMBFR84_34120 [Candidatus Hydrogenedentota bacterium]